MLMARGRCPYFVLTFSVDYYTFVNHLSNRYSFCTTRPTKVLHRWDSVEGCGEDRRQKAEDRRQKTEGRGQKAEVRRQTSARMSVL
jgi:hypothetical protein